MQPISAKFMIDTVTHSPLVQGSRGKTYTPGATITKVCVQDKSIRTYVDGSFIFTSAAMMYWDSTISTGASFRVGDQITYTNKATGEDIKRYIQEGLNGQDFDGLHHLELLLI